MYNGPDHVNGTILKGKYFQHTPNLMYNDVNIVEDHLAKLPIKRGEVSGLAVIDNDENEDGEADFGPAPEQFDILSKDEETVSWSGFTTPIVSSDTDKQIRDLIAKHLTDANVDQAIIDGLVKETTLPTQPRVEPLVELKTRGFFYNGLPLFIY